MSKINFVNKGYDNFWWSWIEIFFDTFLKNAVDNLNIKNVLNIMDVNRTSPYDPVDICILKYGESLKY